MLSPRNLEGSRLPALASSQDHKGSRVRRTTSLIAPIDARRPGIPKPKLVIKPLQQPLDSGSRLNVSAESPRGIPKFPKTSSVIPPSRSSTQGSGIRPRATTPGAHSTRAASNSKVRASSAKTIRRTSTLTGSISSPRASRLDRSIERQESGKFNALLNTSLSQMVEDELKSALFSTSMIPRKPRVPVRDESSSDDDTDKSFVGMVSLDQIDKCLARLQEYRSWVAADSLLKHADDESQKIAKTLQKLVLQIDSISKYQSQPSAWQTAPGPSTSRRQTTIPEQFKAVLVDDRRFSSPSIQVGSRGSIEEELAFEQEQRKEAVAYAKLHQMALQRLLQKIDQGDKLDDAEQKTSMLPKGNNSDP